MAGLQTTRWAGKAGFPFSRGMPLSPLPLQGEVSKDKANGPWSCLATAQRSVCPVDSADEGPNFPFSTWFVLESDRQWLPLSVARAWPRGGRQGCCPPLFGLSARASCFEAALASPVWGPLTSGLENHPEPQHWQDSE